MHAGGALHKPKHQISFTEYARIYLPAMIASEILLVYCRPGQCQFSGFFEQIDIILPSFFYLGFSVQRDSRRVMLNVGRQDRFCPIDKEEWRVAGRAIRCRPETPQHRWQLIQPTTRSALQWFNKPGLYAG